MGFDSIKNNKFGIIKDFKGYPSYSFRVKYVDIN